MIRAPGPYMACWYYQVHHHQYYMQEPATPSCQQPKNPRNVKPRWRRWHLLSRVLHPPDARCTLPSARTRAWRLSRKPSSLVVFLGTIPGRGGKGGWAWAERVAYHKAAWPDATLGGHSGCQRDIQPISGEIVSSQRSIPDTVDLISRATRCHPWSECTPDVFAGTQACGSG